jgi:hypothetical protein
MHGLDEPFRIFGIFLVHVGGARRFSGADSVFQLPPAVPQRRFEKQHAAKVLGRGFDQIRPGNGRQEVRRFLFFNEPQRAQSVEEELCCS